MESRELLQHAVRKVFYSILKKDEGAYTESDFEIIRDIIYSKTNIHFSTRTVRRLYYAFIEEKENYSPHKSTKNGLAKMLGYKDWLDYLTNDQLDKNEEDEKDDENKDEEEDEEEIFNKNADISKENVYQRNKIRIYIILILILMSGIIVFFWLNNNNVKNGKDIKKIKFNAEKTEGYPIFSVSINYDISQYPSDSLRLYCWHTEDKYLNPDNHFWSENYYHPSLKRFQLRDGKKILKEIPILIKSKGWEYALRKSASSNNYTYKPVKTKNGYAYCDSADFKKFNIKDISKFSSAFINFKNFGIPLDDCKIKLRIFANTKTNPYCDYIKIDLWGLKDEFRVSLVNQGCNPNAHLEVPGKKLTGTSTNLDFLMHEINKWHNITLTTSNHKFEMIKNNSKQFSIPYKKKAGELKGILIIGSSFLKMDKIEILNPSNNKTLYLENFE